MAASVSPVLQKGKPARRKNGIANCKLPGSEPRKTTKSNISPAKKMLSVRALERFLRGAICLLTLSMKFKQYHEQSVKLAVFV
jgi:hypothetical protein